MLQPEVHVNACCNTRIKISIPALRHVAIHIQIIFICTSGRNVNLVQAQNNDENQALHTCIYTFKCDSSILSLCCIGSSQVTTSCPLAIGSTEEGV